MDFTPIIQALILLFSIIITRYLIPLIRDKTTAQQRDTANTWVKIAVAAAEQIYKSADKSGIIKKKSVQEFLKAKGITIDDAELDQMIESAVYNLTHIGVFPEELIIEPAKEI